MDAASPTAEQTAPAEAAPTPRRTRPPRACNSRPKALPPAPAPPHPKRRPGRPRLRDKEEEGDGDEEEVAPQCRVVTPLVTEPDAPAELPWWRLRGMWELASVLNFIHVFRPVLNIAVEFTAEELEDAIITPNGMLEDLHIPLLRSIPPVARMGMGNGKWVTVLCRKLKDWWHLVAEGNLPIVASQGVEIETYKELEPATRLVILKAICDIRCEQEDVRNFVDRCLKKGNQLPVFCKERIGGDSHGISYWYEEDPGLGHRLYREIRQVEYVKEQTRKSKGRGVSVPAVSYLWETVATNFVEFEAVAEKLFSSNNRTEVSLGKKLKIHYLPEMEKIHKSKERLLKKQQRQALLLNSYLTFGGFTSGRSHRERKHVTYTFDDYDRSINEAIKAIKKSENSVQDVTTINRRAVDPDVTAINRRVVDPDVTAINRRVVDPDVTAINRRVVDPTRETSNNGAISGPSPACNGFSGGYQANGGEEKAEPLDRRRRHRKRSQRYTLDFVEDVSDIDPDFDSDDEIMGEAVYDEEYLRSRKQPKASTSEDDGEYSSSSEDKEGTRRSKGLSSRRRQATRLITVDEIQIGVKRNKRSARPHMSHQRRDLSGIDAELGKPDKLNASNASAASDAVNDADIPTGSQDQGQRLLHIMKMHTPGRESNGVGGKFLHLNKLPPAVGGFDSAPAVQS